MRIYMRQIGILSMIVCVTATTGCNVCCWGKRAAELESPTDIRKAHFWCLGEDAIFEQPCGPSKEDYGLKTTCWREWPADGGRCKPGTCPPAAGCGLNGNCSPPALPLMVPRHAAPSDWESATPTEALPSPNPFHDDEPSIQAPSGSPSHPHGSEVVPLGPKGSQSTRGTLLGPTARVGVPSVPQLPARRAATRSTSPPRSIAVTPVATKPPTLLDSTAAAPKGVQAERPLKIVVSPEIDTPVQNLPQIGSPTGPVLPEVSRADAPRLEAETLAGFEQMFEAPAAKPLSEARPIVVRNDYAPESNPFRLSTRTSLVKAANDPALKKETLSALESMISGDDRSAPAR